MDKKLYQIKINENSSVMFELHADTEKEALEQAYKFLKEQLEFSIKLTIKEIPQNNNWHRDHGY